jgi:hypothetical protein
MMTVRHAIAVAVCLGACAPDTLMGGEGAPAGDDDSIRPDARTADAAPIPPDAKMVACPPGLPDSFGTLGAITTTKNGPGSPAMFDAYNVFAKLQGNERWFFAMNLDEGAIAAGQTYDIAGDDADVAHCTHCVNLFADLDTTPGGPSLHMFARSGRIIVTSLSADKTKVSGRVEDIMFDAIEVVYDSQSTTCSNDINDPVCDNSICLNNECGRQSVLAGCTTSIKGMTF